MPKHFRYFTNTRTISKTMETTPRINQNFSLVLKVCREFNDVTSAGKLFHIRATCRGDGKRSVADSGQSRERYIWTYEPGGWEGAAAPPQIWAVQFFWAMKKIWAEGIFGVSNIALIHIKRAHANFVLENEMERIIDIFGSRTGRQLFLLVWLNSHRRLLIPVQLYYLVYIHKSYRYCFPDLNLTSPS